MVDLFFDRIIFGFLFIIVGVDIFGLWIVLVRKICGGVINNKWWVIMFSCLIIWVIYIEVIEEMFSFFFINVLWCFEVLCGLVKVFRLDKGIYFVGVVDELGI